MLRQKVQTYIEKNQLLTQNSKIIVGVSGGVDSVVLLYILKKLNYNCIAAHCNFRLRNEESDRDEDFVTKLCLSWNIPLRKIAFDTKEFAGLNKISIEMAARELRYSWFSKLSLTENAEAIAVAHHADDSIETLLLNLLRGTGYKGLTGISVMNGMVVRPLLDCSRKDILEFAKKTKLVFVEDSTNAENEYTRNKIRNQILPLLEEINPSIRQTLYKSTERFAGSYKVYEHAINGYKSKIITKKNNIVYLNIQILKQSPDVFTVLYELLHEYGFSASTVKDIVDCLDEESGKQFSSASYRLIKDRDKLLISTFEKEKYNEVMVGEFQKDITFPVHLKFSEHSITELGEIPRNVQTVVFDADVLKFPLKIRNWKKGDYFVPFGMKNKKKLSDFFIDQKFSIIEKESTFLLESEGEIAWIIGKRTDNRFRITKDTKQVIKISLL